MLSPRWRKVVRDAWLHRARTVTVVLAIVVGLAGAGTVLDSWALLRKVTREEYLATNPASATLRVDSVDEALLRAVRALPAVRDAQARRTVAAGAQLDGGWAAALLDASEKPSTQRIGTLVHEEGQWPPADGALVMEHSSLGFAHAAVGDSIVVRVGNGVPVTLPVTGVVRDAELAPGWMDHVVYGFVTPATLARLGVPSSLNELQILTRDRTLDRAGIRTVAREVRDLTERMGHRVSAVDVPIPGRHMHAAQMDSLLMTMGAFGVLALLMSGFLVVNLVTATLAGQLREIGVMKAVGARTAQLAAMYLVFALGLGVLASAIAIPLAAYVGRAYARFAATMLNFDITGYTIPLYAILLQVAAGLLLPVLAAAVPVMRGSRIPVADALRDTGIRNDASVSWIDRIHGLRRPLLLSLRNAFRRRWRMALTLVTLASGGAAFLGALDLRAAIRASVQTLYEDRLRFDVAVRLSNPHAADSVLATVTRVAGVAHAEAFAGARVTLADADELEASIPVTAIPSDSRLITLPVTEGRALGDSAAPEFVVTRQLLDEHPSLAQGGQVELMIGGRRSRWTVVGIVESAGPGAAAFATRASLARVTGDARVSSVVVRTTSRDGARQGEVLQRVRDSLEGDGMAVESSQLMQASRRAIEDHLLMVGDFLLAMAQLTILVGALALASTMSLAVQERTREIGVLRAMGGTPRSIMTMVQAEGLVIVCLSWAIAVPLSLPISVLLGRAFGRILLPVPTSFVPQGGAVAVWLALAVVVSVLACAWPALRATRTPIVAALAYE